MAIGHMKFVNMTKELLCIRGGSISKDEAKEEYFDMTKKDEYSK